MASRSIRILYKKKTTGRFKFLSKILNKTQTNINTDCQVICLYKTHNQN